MQFSNLQNESSSTTASHTHNHARGMTSQKAPEGNAAAGGT